MERPVLGIDLGGTKIDVAVVDASNGIIGRARAKTEAWRGQEGVFERIVRIAGEALQEAALKPADLSAVGIGSPGPLDPDTGYIIETGNLKFKNFPLGPRLGASFGCPVTLDNDVNAGTYGEFKAGAAQGAQHVLGMFIGTGIGGGLVIDGALYHGFSKNAGEVGHMVIMADGPKCGCGRRGCLEALASRTAIAREARKSVKRGQKTALTELVGKEIAEVTSGVLRDALKADDKLTKKLVRRAAKYIGIGVGSLVNVLGPQVVVLGGGLIEAVGKEVLEIIDHYARRTAFDFSIKDVSITPAQLGDDAGVIGAAILAREKLSAGPP